MSYTYAINNETAETWGFTPFLTKNVGLVRMAKRIIQNKSKFPRGVPQEMHQKIIDYYLEGYSTYKTGNKFGISDVCAGNILKKNNIPRRVKALKLDYEIIPLYLSGMTAPEIEEKLSVSASHVYDVLRRHKIKTDKSKSGVSRRLSIPHRDKIIELYKQGLSAPSIAKELGLHSHWVRRFLVKNGVEMRPRGERSGAMSTKWRGGLTTNKEYQRKKLNNYNKKRRDTDPVYKLKCSLLNRIKSAFKTQGYKKNSRTQVLLGASYEEVSLHIEAQFRDGMTWKNHGKEIGKWNFDHIIPLASAVTEDQLIALFHYTNIQPLWWKENMSKGSLYNGKRHSIRTKKV